MLGSWALEVGGVLQSGRLDTEPRAKGLDGQTGPFGSDLQKLGPAKALEQSRCAVSGRSTSFRGRPLGASRQGRGCSKLAWRPAHPDSRDREMAQSSHLQRTREGLLSSPGPAPGPTEGSLLCPA